MTELAPTTQPAASSDPGWERELPGSDPAPAPVLPSVAIDPVAPGGLPSAPDSAWTSELPAAADAPASAGATSEVAWEQQLPAIPAAEPAPPAAKPAIAVDRPAAAEGSYTLSQHIADKPAAVVDLFGQLDEYGRSFEATRRIGREHVEYLRGAKRWFTIEVQPERVLLCLSLDAATVEAWWWSPTAKQYTIDIRQRASGEIEFAVGGVDELEDARQLIKLAYGGPSAAPQKP